LFSRFKSKAENHVSRGGIGNFIVASMLLIHAALIAWIGFTKPPNVDEMGHLPAGISHWNLADFELYRVNPPLVRLVAALPVVFSGAKSDWRRLHDKNWRGRREWQVGADFVAANGQRSFWLFCLARWTCIPFSVMGGLFCFRWASRLYGRHSGYLALALWSFSPTVCGNAAMITPDIGAATCGVAACYCFWRWLLRPGWSEALLSAASLGIAELAKTTLLVFYPLWTGLLLLWRATAASGDRPARPHRLVAHFVLIITGSLCVLNAAYRCDGSGQRLGDYRFESRALAGTRALNDPTGSEPNRFDGTILAPLRVPLPADYVLGIDMQKLNFEQGTWSYLDGTWRLGGWWYFYLYALAVKVPLGTWCLVGLAVVVTVFGRGYNAAWRDEMVVLAPGLAILVFVSSQTGFSVHSRYVIPALPFFFIWVSKVGRVFETRPFASKRLALAVGVAMALTWSVASALWAYPHSLSYFNELVCGPKNGGEHLLDSNIDWGQDLRYLKHWLDEHPDVKLTGLAYSGAYPVVRAGIPETPFPPKGPDIPPGTASDGNDESGPRSAWYAVSVNYLYERGGDYHYFQRFKPVAMAGYSIYIYHVTSDETNRVRRELGTPKLPEGNKGASRPEAGARTYRT
jgi:hypothetical protein